MLRGLDTVALTSLRVKFISVVGNVVAASLLESRGGCLTHMLHSREWSETCPSLNLILLLLYFTVNINKTTSLSSASIAFWHGPESTTMVIRRRSSLDSVRGQMHAVNFVNTEIFPIHSCSRGDVPHEQSKGPGCKKDCAAALDTPPS